MTPTCANCWNRFFLTTHEEVFSLSRQKPEWEDMGTTAVIALIRGDRLWIAHVGDSRAYLIENRTIRLLTHDHTFVADWLSDGIITPEEAKTHPARHGLYMAMGIDDDIEPEISMHPWEKGVCRASVLGRTERPPGGRGSA